MIRQKQPRFNRRFVIQSGLVLVLVALGFATGWFFKGNQQPGTATRSNCLRLSGYTFVSPLLLCDTVYSSSNPALSKLQGEIEKVIQARKADGSITNASVYFRDLTIGRDLTVNPEEHFFPASLKKVPLMMQLYKEAESDPNVMAEKRVLSGVTNFNADAAIPPKQTPEYGESYSTQDLIDYMIKYSDNISFQVLLQSLGAEKFNQMYKNMQLNYPDAVVAIDDYTTPYQFSLFFRTLYNATYLSATNSEKALELLSQSDFKNGIAAGLPDGVKTAHKFGVGVVTQADGAAQGELHDCGIVYKEANPYLLCIMTKSKSELKQVEQTIADISTAVYKGTGTK